MTLRLLSTIVLLALAAPIAGADDRVNYLRDIKPMLAARCYACHGALQQKAKLRVDTAKALRDAGVVVIGKSAESAMVKHVLAADGFSKMPPPADGEALTEKQVALLKKWIDEGADAPADELADPDPREHWAFRAPVKPPVPKFEIPNFTARNPIDTFLSIEWAKHRLNPQPAADKRLLLRRVTLDLTGLPPTAEEMDAFIKDTSPTAYEKVVNRLLASPQYGERWGRHFLDVWRYSDWWGLGAEVRNSQKHMWHWRDWTVESLNADKGYDQMLREMLAADELYPTDPEKLRATGFMARQYFKFNRTSWLDETIEHTGKAFLGLTLNCAKCHDHKYDPIAANDYYRLRAVFEPYQVRTDMVVGVSDFEKDGIPRAFDCNLDAVTYKHERGDDRRPLTNTKIAPGLPPLLTWSEFTPKPVKLPPEAFAPHLQRHVESTLIAELEQQHASAVAALAKADLDLTTARRHAALAANEPKTPSKPAAPKSLVKDDFAKLDAALWEIGAGMWKHDAGTLTQLNPTAERSHVRLKRDVPTDFEARLRFTITGGAPYQSVGISFDVVDGNDILVYASGGGSKVQVAYKNGGGFAYPPESAVGRTVKPNVPHELVVRTRGPLVNVELDGDHVIAYTLPIARKPGKLELITYTATAAFRGFELSELPSDFALIDPKTKATTKPPTVEQATAAHRVAQTTAAYLLSKKTALQAALAADRARFADPPASNAKELIAAAAKAEKLATAAKTEDDLAKAEHELALAATAQKAAAQKKVDAAKIALVAAKKAAETSGDAYTSPRGSLKTLESNLESEASRSKAFPTTSTGRRTALVEWLADKRNPLTARVVVNHVWMRHFGKPLVPTIFDFGRKGTKPTHPELLDWLAVEFMEHNWSLKHLHQLIVTSSAYRMSSSTLGGEANAKADPENRFLWRQNPIRMEAQAVRDSLLHLAGQLDRTIGGPSVPPAMQDTSMRRSLYFFQSHNEHHKFLSQFDDANVLDCYRRTESIVPQQALTLSNSRFALTMAEAIAKKLSEKYAKASDEAFVTAAFETILAATPSKDESAACLAAIKEWRTELETAKHADPTAKARANLVTALLNHNDFVTVR